MSLHGHAQARSLARCFGGRRLLLLGPRRALSGCISAMVTGRSRVWPLRHTVMVAFVPGLRVADHARQVRRGIDRYGR